MATSGGRGIPGGGLREAEEEAPDVEPTPRRLEADEGERGVAKSALSSLETGKGGGIR